MGSASSVARSTRTRPHASGTAPVYSSFLGGSHFDFGEGIAVDASGAAYVVGDTRSLNFPTTSNAFDRDLGGFQDAFLTKVQPDGSSLAWSTLVGGTWSDIGGGRDYARAVVVDGTGHAYVTGFTGSAAFWWSFMLWPGYVISVRGITKRLPLSSTNIGSS